MLVYLFGFIIPFWIEISTTRLLLSTVLRFVCFASVIGYVLLEGILMCEFKHFIRSGWNRCNLFLVALVLRYYYVYGI